MRRFLAALLLAGCSTAPPAAERTPDVPAAVVAEGIPPVSEALRERLRQYQNVRGAGFRDWGPDGSLFVSTRFGETSQIHRVRTPGGRREQVTFFHEPVSSARYVRSTGDLLISKARGGNEDYQIFRFDGKTGRAARLTDGKSRNRLGPLSRAGARLVYTSNRRNRRDFDLYVLDLRAGTSSRIMEVSGQFWIPIEWSPDDSKLLLLRYVSINESTPAVLDVKSGKRTDLPIPGGGKAAFSGLAFRDDRHVLLSCDAGSEFKRLAVVPLDTLKYEWLEKERQWDVTGIEVHGDTVATLTNEDGTSRLTIGGKGRAPRRAKLPVGLISSLRFSPDGARLGFTLSRPDAPSDVYTYEIAGEKLVRWTYSEVGGLDPETFVAPRRIEYRTFDGRKIPAYLFMPRNAGKVPVVIRIHGGPEGQYRPSFSGTIQYWVNELGVAVIAPNVRGSAGYGKTYVRLDNGKKREESVKDIGALLDWIATQPELDASRVAVYGGSYGGYMVLASLVHFGDRIKAGVDFVGIANFVTFLEKTRRYRVDLRRVEYGDERDPDMRAFLERISPSTRADRIRSALLVAHGRNDPRVPFFEAEQIVARVRAQGRPVWTLYADNEGHGFSRKENRDYFAAATALFFSEHLLK